MIYTVRLYVANYSHVIVGLFFFSYRYCCLCVWIYYTHVCKVLFDCCVKVKASLLPADAIIDFVLSHPQTHVQFVHIYRIHLYVNSNCVLFYPVCKTTKKKKTAFTTQTIILFKLLLEQCIPHCRMCYGNHVTPGFFMSFGTMKWNTSNKEDRKRQKIPGFT